MATTTASSTSSDQEKFLAAKLIARAQLKLIATSLCDKVEQPMGTGATAYFVRYNRMNVPVTTLTEGSDPTAQAASVSPFNVTLDQWGDVIEITDLAELETKHPLVQQCVELLAENAQRVIDREIQIVWLANTNVIYGDGSVTARSSITADTKISDQLINKARVTLVDAGAPPREGPSGGMAVETGGPQDASINGSKHYAGLCGPHVMADVMTAGTSLGTFASVAMYANQKALYNAEVGTWLGVRWVESNFIPKFTLLGNKTTAVVSGQTIGTGGPTVTAGSGGSLKESTTFFFKVTRKDLLRGFEEAISIPHSMATPNTTPDDTGSFAFLMPSTAGFVYNVYMDSVSTGGTGTDATLLLAASNVAASATATITSVGTGAAAPANIRASNDGDDPTTIHPVYLLGADACRYVGLQNLQTMITKDESIMGNVLRLKRALGYKFMAKAIVADTTRLLRLEVASSFG